MPPGADGVGDLVFLAVARASHQFSVGLVGVPPVGIADPLALLAGQEAGLDLPGGGLAVVADDVEAEGLGQDRAVGEGPGASRVPLGLLLDPLQAGDRGEVVDLRPVGPLGGDHVERERGRVRLEWGDRGEDAGPAQAGREFAGWLVGVGGRLEPVEAGHLVDHVHLAGVVGAEAGEAERGVDQLLVPEGLGPVVLDPPDAAGGPVAVDVGPDQVGDPASVDPAPGERAGLAVGVLGGRREDRVGPRLALDVEGVGPFADAPAVVASLLDQVRLLPEVLPLLPTQSWPDSRSKLSRQGFRRP